MRPWPLTAACLCLLHGLQPQPATPDEVRMRDGEVLHGAVESMDTTTLVLRQARGLRRLKRADIDEQLPGEDPMAELARRTAALAADDVAARVQLAQWALTRHLDAQARILAREAHALDPLDQEARSLAGAARLGGAVVEAFPLPDALRLSFGRRYGAAREQVRSSHGGAAVDEAVRAGLDWLARHQEPDGSIDADGFMRHDPQDDRSDGAGGGHHGERVACPFDGAVTAAALMAFMADGSTPSSGPYRESVRRALGWCRARLQRLPIQGYEILNAGHVVQAVAEAYQLTRDPELRAPLEAAVHGLLRLQRPDGGFSYIYEVGDAPTTAVAGLALAQAARSDIPVPRAPLERLLEFLDARVDSASGRSEYHAGAEQKGYTPTRANAASGLAVRALLGRLEGAPHQSAQLREATSPRPRWKLEEREVKTRDGRTVKAQVGSLYPIHWHHATVALAAGRASGPDRWWASVKNALLEGQRRQGAAAGSWDPLGPYSLSAGRAYITALSVQMLRAPLRFARP